MKKYGKEIALAGVQIALFYVFPASAALTIFS